MKVINIKYVFLVICFFLVKEIQAQSEFSLEDCYALANENFPLIKQKDLISKSADYTVSNISKGVLPQLVLNGQATYQSEVTKISIPIQGFTFKSPSKEQYKVYADITQPITELFTVKDQKVLTKENAEIQKQSIDAELYKLRDRLNQLYFGILLIDEQLTLNKLVDKDLESGKMRVNAAIKNGVDYKSSLDKIKAELIKNTQRAIELRSQRNAFTDMLSYFINKPMSETTILLKPTHQKVSTSMNRPELKMYETKASSFSIQNKIVRNKNIPKLSLFLQAGAGQPSPLNMISNSFKPYYLGGLRASWNIMNLYTRKNELELLQLDKQANEVQKDLFIFNTNITSKQQQNEIAKLNELLLTDDDLVNLRASVKATSSVQLENGIISTNDFIKEVNAEDQARQQKLLHEIQLLTAQYNLQTTLGN